MNLLQKYTNSTASHTSMLPPFWPWHLVWS